MSGLSEHTEPNGGPPPPALPPLKVDANQLIDSMTQEIAVLIREMRLGQAQLAMREQQLRDAYAQIESFTAKLATLETAKV